MTTRGGSPPGGLSGGNQLNQSRLQPSVPEIESSFNTVIARLFNSKPNLGKSLYAMLQVFIKEKRRIPIGERQLLEHYSTEQLVQTATEMCYSIEKRTLFTQDIKDMIENMMLVMERIDTLAKPLAIALSRDVTKLILIIADLATELQLLELVTPLDWIALSEVVKMREKNGENLAKYNLLRYIPKMAELESVKLVGSGGFGAVYRGIYIPANITICIKVVPESRLPTIECVAADKLVASIINSPFLIQYLSVFKVEDAYITLMEFVDGVDMKRLMAFQKFLPNEILPLVIVQMFLGIEHLHYKGFVHRDIKLQNVLIKGSGHLKVIDFDTNKLCLSNFVKGRTMAAFFKRTAREFRDNELAGTLPYMPPESFKEVESKMGFPYGRAVDWWSLGVTLYRLCTGRLPFRGSTEQELQDRVLHGPVTWSPSDLRRSGEDAVDMANRFLIKNPSKRLGSGTSYREIRVHPFFGGIDMATLHTLTTLADIPYFREAMGISEDGRPVAPAGPAPSNKGLDIKSLKDAPLIKQKPILTFASPGFMKLIDHLRSLRANQIIDQQFCEDRRLYGLGTYSSDRNYETDGEETSKPFDYRNLEAMIGVHHFVTLQVDADSKQGFQGFTYFWDLVEVKGVSGVSVMIWNLRGETMRRSGLIVGDIIYQIDDVKTQEGLERIRNYIRSRPTIRVCVFAMTPFRLADMGLNVPLAVSWVGRKDILVTRYVRRQFQPVRAFDLLSQVMQGQSKTRRPIYLHVIGRIDRKFSVTFPPGEALYVGDVLLAVNGASTTTMRSRDDVMVAINLTKQPNVQLTILPVSPLRLPEVSPAHATPGEPTTSITTPDGTIGSTVSSESTTQPPPPTAAE
ncbi:protein kinase-like [Tropilaelaps mercedesae]|uniref:Serine/threonine-protein kinase greatwall n=1 Tax=Tropilaelaps mercedesae TaxID=418985 RepID=A0A1V9XF72_9ACAR|nr:protein kinase-like [Tropilaelaps mercedesae]